MNSDSPNGEFVFSTAQAGAETIYFLLSRFFKIGLRFICWICSKYFSENPRDWAIFMSNESGGKSIEISMSEIEIATENYRTGVQHPEPVFYDFVLGNNHIGFDVSKIDGKSFHIFGGELDGLTSIEGSIELSKLVKGSKLHIIKGFGHYLFTNEICRQIFNLV